MSTQHPALRDAFLHLTLLHAQYAHMTQHNAKLAHKTLVRLLQTAQPADAAHRAYAAQLLLVAHHLAAPSDTDVDAALAVVEDLRKRAAERDHTDVCTLAQVTRVRTLVSAGRWDALGPALEAAESALGISYPAPSPSAAQPEATQQPSQATPTAPSSHKPPAPQTPFAKAMCVIVLMLGTLFHTHAGSADAASARLADLHALLDNGALEAFPSGSVPVCLLASSFRTALTRICR
jgi:hypothetical protein